DQRPGEARVAERTLRERDEDGLDALHVRPTRRLLRRQLDGSNLAVTHHPEQLHEQLALRAPVAIQGARGQAGSLGHRGHGGGGVTALLHELLGRAQEALARGERSGGRRHHAGSARAMMARASTPAGSVPYTRPPPFPSLAAQNASATAAGAKRTS